MEGIGVGIDGSEVGGEARIVLCSCGAASTGNGNGFRTDRNAFVLVPVSPMSGLAFGERSEVIKVRGGRCESHRSLARLRPSAAWLMLRRKSAWSFERFPSATVFRHRQSPECAASRPSHGRATPKGEVEVTAKEQQARESSDTPKALQSTLRSCGRLSFLA